MGNCYSNLSTNNPIINNQFDHTSTVNNNNLIFLSNKNCETENLNTLTKESDSNQQQLNNQDNSHLSSSIVKPLKYSVSFVDDNINNNSKKCNNNQLTPSKKYHKCLKYNNRRSPSSTPSSTSSSRTSTPKLSKSPSHREKAKVTIEKRKKLLNKLRDTLRSRKQSNQKPLNSVKINENIFSDNSDDLIRIEIDTTNPNKNQQQQQQLSNSTKQTTLIQSYQVSFVPEISELLEVVLSSEDDDDDLNDKTISNDQKTLKNNIKKENFLKRFYLTKSGRWKKSNHNDNNDKMSRIKPSTQSSNNPASSTSSLNYHQHIITGNNKLEVNDDDNSKQQYKSSKLLPPTQISSLFRGFRSRIPSSSSASASIVTSKSTGNVNGHNLPPSRSNQLHTQTITKTNSIKNNKINEKSKSTLSKNELNSCIIKASSSSSLLTKPISAPTLNSAVTNAKPVTASSSRSSSLNRNTDNNQSANTKVDNNDKNQVCKLPSSIHMLATKATNANINDNIFSNHHNGGTKLPLSKLPATSKLAINNITNNNNNSCKTQAKTLTISPIRTQQALIVPIQVSNNSNDNDVNEEKINKISNVKNLCNYFYAAPDINRIGIPLKPTISMQNNDNQNRQLQRLNFLYGNIEQTVNRSNISQQQQSLPRSKTMNQQQQSNALQQQQQQNSTMMKNSNDVMNIAFYNSNHNKINNYNNVVSRIKTNFIASKQLDMIGGSNGGNNKNGTGASLNHNHYFNPYGRYNIRDNNNHHNQTNIYRAIPTTIQSSNIPFGVGNRNINGNIDQKFINSNDKINNKKITNGNFQTSSPKPMNMKTFEDFHASNNKNNRDVQMSKNNSSTLTKRRIADNDNVFIKNNYDNNDDKQIIQQQQQQEQQQEKSNYCNDISELGTFSGCSSSVSMVDDEFDEDLDELSSESCSARNDNKLVMSGVSAQLTSSSISNNNDNNLIRSTLSNAQPALSASVCSTASTTSSFVFDYNHNRQQQSNIFQKQDSFNNNHNQNNGNFNNYRTRNGSTSTSSCSNRDLFLIDDEIADQPGLLISDTTNNNNSLNDKNDNVRQTNLSLTLNKNDKSNDSIEKDWILSPTKTLTPSSKSNSTNNESSSIDSPSIIINNNNIDADISTTIKDDKIRTSSITSSTNSYDSMLQSLNNELENLILQTTKIDHLKQSFDTNETLSDSNNHKNDINNNDSSPSNNQNIQLSSFKPSAKIRKRHSYTSSSSSTTTNHLHKVPVFRRPRPLSFVENDDGSYGLDSSSLRAVAQDLISIKTLLIRLQNVLQNAETQNPFESVLNNRYTFDSATTSTKSSTPISSATTTPSHNNDHSYDETMQLLREENHDLRQHCQLMEQKLIEKDHTIKLLQQQMSKYTTTVNNSNNHRILIERKNGNQFVQEDFHNNNNNNNNNNIFIPEENNNNNNNNNNQEKQKQLSNLTTNHYYHHNHRLQQQQQKSSIINNNENSINSTTQSEQLLNNIIMMDREKKFYNVNGDNNKANNNTDDAGCGDGQNNGNRYCWIKGINNH